MGVIMLKSKKAVLISMIGKGRSIVGKKGYEKTNYYFEEIDKSIDTCFFGSALYKVLVNQGYEIDKWLIFGTEQSSWSELLNVIDEENHDELIDLYDRVYDEENMGISQELLSEWQDSLKEYMPGIRFITVDPLDYEVYINHMIKEIPDEERIVVFDITHAFRHMPVIIAFSLMMLKHIKRISDIKVYYGAFELKKDRNDPTPVINIDFISTLVSYAENLATYKYSGYFPELLKLLDTPDMNKTYRAYFWLEMNRQPKSDLSTIKSYLEKIESKDNYQSAIAKYVKKDLKSLIGASLDRRMIERGKFFFKKKQYLKALILLYEGIIIAIGREYKDQIIEMNKKIKNIDPLDYDAREIIRDFIKLIKTKELYIFEKSGYRDTYELLEYTRNAAVHGSENDKVKKYLEKQGDFKILFRRGLELYESIAKTSPSAQKSLNS